MQYLDGGPCVQAASQNREVSIDDTDALNEDAWLMFARAEAVAGIRATLSLPITKHGKVVGGVNLYANQEHAFDGQDKALAGVFGAWAGGAVANADLSFTTRQQALRAPATLKANARIHNAVGVIIAVQRISADEAQGASSRPPSLPGYLP